MSSDQPRSWAMRYAAASCTRRACSAGSMGDFFLSEATPMPVSSGCFSLRRAARRAGVRHLEQELLHVPGAGRAALGAQPAVQAHILVLDHHAPGPEALLHIQVLREVLRRRAQARAQVD